MKNTKMSALDKADDFRACCKQDMTNVHCVLLQLLNQVDPAARQQTRSSKGKPKSGHFWQLLIQFQ